MGDAKRGHSNTKQETAIKMAKYLLMDGFFLTSALFIIFFVSVDSHPRWHPT